MPGSLPQSSLKGESGSVSSRRVRKIVATAAMLRCRGTSRFTTTRLVARVVSRSLLEVRRVEHQCRAKEVRGPAASRASTKCVSHQTRRRSRFPTSAACTIFRPRDPGARARKRTGERVSGCSGPREGGIWWRAWARTRRALTMAGAVAAGGGPARAAVSSPSTLAHGIGLRWMYIMIKTGGA